MVVLEGAVRADELLEARLGEVKFLGGRGGGSLEWRLRRRSRSHWLVRRRGRGSARDGDTGGPRSSRRAKRRSRSFWRDRERDGAWLETHRWFAKRFHMGIEGGVRVAMRAVDRGMRSAVRAADSKAVLGDISFWRARELTKEQLKRYAEAIRNGKHGAQFVVRSLDRKSSPTGSVDSAVIAWVWTHPDADLSAVAAGARDVSGELLRFRIIGPHVKTILKASFGTQIVDDTMCPVAARLSLTGEGGCIAPLESSPLWERRKHDLEEGATMVDSVLVPLPAMLTGGFGRGMDVIVASGMGMATWMRLVLSGATVVGRKEMRTIALEGGLFQFPKDWPADPPGESPVLRRTTGGPRPRKRTRYAGVVVHDHQRLAKIFGFPAGRPPEAKSQRSWAPSTSSGGAKQVVSDVFELVPVRLEVRCRGVPHDGAVIYAPTDDDLAQWRQERSNFNGRFIQDGTDRVIGRVMTGGHSLLRGHGFASAAWIQAPAAESMFNSPENRRRCKRGRRQPPEVLVLIRNLRGSRWGRTAFAVPVLQPDWRLV